MAKSKILIYGSCVSRDPIDEWVKDGSIDLVYYLSKTSTASQISNKGQWHLPLPEGSDFASRMVRHDIEGDAKDLINNVDFDWILFDFIDDRLPLIRVGNGQYTASRFFENFYYKELKEIWKPKSLTTAEHRSEYLVSLRKFLLELKSFGLDADRIIIHRAWWARHERAQAGVVTLADEEVRQAAHEQNLTLRMAYEIFEEIFPSCKKIEAPKSYVVSEPNHKWGNDPYHYIEPYNVFFRESLLRIMQESKSAISKNPVKSRSAEEFFDSVAAYEKPETRFFQQNSRLDAGTSSYFGVQDRRNPFIDHYGIDLPYITHHKEYVAKFRDTGVIFDETGVPNNMFRWGGPYRYPVTIGHHGLSCLSRYMIDKDVGEAQVAASVVKWLIANQSTSGAWGIFFDHDWFPGRCSVIKAPWVSAMGQGLCISLLARTCHLIRSGQWPSTIQLDHDAALRCARSAVRPYSIRTEDGGVRSLLFDKFVFFEEYPTKPASFVLNGFIYSLLGLYDLWSLTKEAEVKRFYEEGIDTLNQCLPLYDLGRASAYDLTHITSHTHVPNIARPSYHFIHIQLLNILNILESGKFSVVLDRWWKYYKGWGGRTN